MKLSRARREVLADLARHRSPFVRPSSKRKPESPSRIPEVSIGGLVDFPLALVSVIARLRGGAR